jgi:hypothetical protein
MITAGEDALGEGASRGMKRTQAEVYSPPPGAPHPSLPPRMRALIHTGGAFDRRQDSRPVAVMPAFPATGTGCMIIRKR